MIKKLLTIGLITGALFSLTATTALAKTISYNHYDDRYLDHWNYNTPDYDIYDDWDYWEINHSNNLYYSYDKNYNTNYLTDYNVKNYNNFNLNLNLSDKYNYVVQPFIYDLWYDDVYTNYYFPTAVGAPYVQKAVAPVMNYYYPPFSYYVY